MKRYTIDKLRNVALVAHGGAGKTTLAEAMLHTGGAINRRGTVEEGTTSSDHDPEEIRRQISINASLLPCEWNDGKINIVDTPGYFDFVGDVLASLRVVEGAVVVVCAVSGVEVGTEKVSTYCDRYGLARIVFINKMDRENANWSQVVGQLKHLYGAKAIPVQVPIGAAEDFRGYVDLVSMKAYIADANGKVEEAPIPTDIADEVEEARQALLEAAAATDDELTMKFLEDEPLTDEEVLRGLAAGTEKGDIIPILCGSAVKEIGIDHMLSFILACSPSPAEAPPVHGADARTGGEV